MASAFDIQEFSDYPEIVRIFEKNQALIYEHEEKVIDKASFLALLSQAEIEQKILVFHNIDFAEIALANREVHVPIIFTKCRFKGQLRATNLQFTYKIFFHSVVFQELTRFKLSSFFRGMSFLDCTFKEEVSFERAKFLATNIKYLKREHSQWEINFPEAFNGRNTVDFLGVTFYKEVCFNNTHFGCSTLFASYHGRHTKFFEQADFSCIAEETETFELGMNATGHMIEKEIHMDNFHRIGFLEVEFRGETTFENRNFQKRTIFKDTVFYHAPKFHNAELHQDTDFRGADFKDTYSEGAERAYRTLKLIMDKKRARREEGMFFALEQKSILNSSLKAYHWRALDSVRTLLNQFIKRVVFSKEPRVESIPLISLETDATKHYTGFYVSLTEKILSFFYFLCSNYGQSFKRPLGILFVVVFGIFPLIYRFSFEETKIIASNWDAAYQLSFQQLFRPFEIYAVRFREHYPDTPFSLYLIASLESLLNIGLVTLFALAVRGRFRMY